MALFGQYLIEKKLITAKDLVQALLLQLKLTPHPAILAMEHSILNDEELLAIFNIQNTHNLDFLSALSTSSISPVKKRQVDELLLQKQKPLPTILMENKFLEIKDLIKALDEYLSEQAKRPSSSTPETQVSALATALSKSPTQPSPRLQAASNSTFQFIPLNPLFKGELENSLNLKSVREINNVLSLVKQNSSNRDLVVQFLADVKKSVSAIKGLAKAAQAPLIEKICDLMDRSISASIEKQSSNHSPLEDELIPTLQKGLLFCSQAKDSLQNNETEEAFWIQQQTQFEDLEKRLLA